MDEMENESIKLISGIKFVQYLYDFDVGFEIAEKYELKKSCPDVLDEFFN